MASKQAHPGCLVLFGLIFVIAGSIPGCIALHDLSTAEGTASWSETTAVLLTVDKHQGDDTWSVEAKYRYRAPDPESLEPGAMRDYDGLRVGIHSGSDNIGSWQEDTYRRLHKAWKSGQPVPCWYDPAQPAQAVLDRTPRWELVGFMFIFPLVFGLAGGGIAWFGISLWRKRGQPAPEPQVLAQQTVIRAESRSGCVMWVVAIIWNAISTPVLFVLLPDSDVPFWAKLLFGLFPLIGLALLWAALLGTLRRLRHGRTELRLDQGSWNAGRTVHATVVVRTAPQPDDVVEAKLAVVRTVTTGSGEDERTSEQTEWSVVLPVDAMAARNAGGMWAYALDLPLPSDLPLPGERLVWRLEWSIVRPGPDLSERFVLPVAAATDGAELQAAAVAAAVDRADPLAVLRRAGVRVTEERGDVVIHLPAWRNPGLHLSGLIASAILTGAAYGLWLEVGWWTALLSLPILLLSWRAALRSASWRSTITLGSGRVAVAAGWWRLLRHELKSSEISAVERRSSMSSGETAWHNMWLQTGDGARIAIARGIAGPAAARLAEMIEAMRR